MTSTYQQAKHCAIFLGCILGPWIIGFLIGVGIYKLWGIL